MEDSVRRLWLVALLPILAFSAIDLESAAQGVSRRLPGVSELSGTLLPNGWTLTPAGEQIQVGDLPLAIVLHPDGRHLLVSNNGNGMQSIDAIDLAKRSVVSRTVVEKAWLGLGVSSDGQRVFAGGGMSNTILVFSFDEGRLTPLDPIPVGEPDTDLYPSGLCISGQRLYVANNLGNSLSAVDLSSGTIVGSVPVGDYPYTCIASEDGKKIYVSVWGAAQVAVVGADSLTVTARIATDDHPNAMIFSKDGKRLFVANANSNTISVVDLAAGKAVERISVALYPNSPAGSTTNALALSPDGSRLFAANADNNDVALIDITKSGESKVLGFIPVGWYPTALAVSPDGKTLYVANGKGLRSLPNPKGPQPTMRSIAGTEHIGRLLLGTVSIIPVPDPDALARYTAQVYKNVPYSEKIRLSVPFSGRSAIPRSVGEKSAIKHVIYIIKENRTYDQVFGDIKEGNGDPSLTLFGEEVTPNLHALVREFVLLDNFYCDAEVSADGHNWSMGAYATDYVEKTWPSQYSRRRKTYDYEGGSAIVAPSAGYIWDACKRAGVSYRSYGEWVVNGLRPDDPARPSAAALEGRIDPKYRGWDLTYSDVDRAKRFLSELRRFEAEGDMPRCQIVRLPNDHTMGMRPSALSPRSYIAQNDLALGMVVEGVSHSKFWPTTAIFVIEDDAQNGPDHVDAHRTEALAISPYIKRRTVDSTMYSTSSMLRTMELILGVPPMSQYDASATSMFASFADKPDLTPYTSRPAKVSLTEYNPADGPGAGRSMEMDFDEADAAPDIELNEIIWKSIKGENSIMPAPVRSAFVRPIEKKD
jgi:YVTN family beta-propeller protein